MKIIIFISLTIVSILSLKLQTNNFLRSKEDYDNEKVIVNANGQESPMIPVAAGIGGEECQKLIDKFVNRCVDEESNGVQATTFRAFCESYREKHEENVNVDLCLILNAKLASVTNESGAEIVDPTKAPNVCIKFKNECNKLGGGAKCYSGFCESVAECIDCPAALVDKHNNGKFELEVCGNNGICRLGWKNPDSKGGNGYCECKNNMKGISCNEF